MKIMKIMKNTKTKNHFNFTIVFTSIFIITSFAAFSIGGFNRSTAAGMIEESKQYKNPATITINLEQLINSRTKTPQTSVEDTKEAATIRVKEAFTERHAAITVIERLGYITINFDEGELRFPNMGEPNYQNDLKIWEFNPRAEITEKGKKLWTDLGLNVNEKSLPVGIRQTPEITGMRDETKTMKGVEFTYEWQPNELGKSLDPNTDEFKNLPVKLQEQLKKKHSNIFGVGSNSITNFSGKRNGKAYFKNFDDGWRLDSIPIM